MKLMRNGEKKIIMIKRIRNQSYHKKKHKSLIKEEYF